MKLFAGEALLMVSPFPRAGDHQVLLGLAAKQLRACRQDARDLGLLDLDAGVPVCGELQLGDLVVEPSVAFVLIFPFSARYITWPLLSLHILWGVVINSVLTFTYVVVPVQALLGQMPGMESERSYGWDQLTTAIVRAREEHGAEFLVTNRFETASELAFRAR